MNLKLNNIKFSSNNDGHDILTPSATDICVETETAKFTFDTALPIGNAKLEICFDGVLDDKMKGLYRSKYTS